MIILCARKTELCHAYMIKWVGIKFFSIDIDWKVSPLPNDSSCWCETFSIFVLSYKPLPSFSLPSKVLSPWLMLRHRLELKMLKREKVWYNCLVWHRGVHDLYFMLGSTTKKYTSVMIRVCHSTSFFCHACTSMTNLWQNEDSHTCAVVEVFHDITKIIITEVSTSMTINHASQKCFHQGWPTCGIHRNITSLSYRVWFWIR